MSNDKQTVSGFVHYAIIGEGTRSEHEEIVIDTDNARLGLRMMNGGTSAVFNRFVGSRVTAEGMASWGKLYVSGPQDIKFKQGR